MKVRSDGMVPPTPRDAIALQVSGVIPFRSEQSWSPGRRGRQQWCALQMGLLGPLRNVVIPTWRGRFGKQALALVSIRSREACRVPRFGACCVCARSHDRGGPHPRHRCRLGGGPPARWTDEIAGECPSPAARLPSSAALGDLDHGVEVTRVQHAGRCARAGTR
jgi:hypothetical protein